ncbi:uncharacterized protein lcorl [Trichomycterus rosablanca]|uniref:uncharacterized protein lcorl n=1 Tax=Trichomycterus rosablanca TaxID=2290929 RepID=UPI002F3523E8
MATRCCSARCSAERRGFRRELDSWRHKLIHCVGFESILEGIYGPRLLQDLSIFDNCEPETAADWSTDVRCSFCNLQLDRISELDRSPDSPPRAETPPQGLNTSDTLQCQADRFLHAVLHKKEFPESFDPIIPLAAQELMRKMIRQFAVEYAHKIQTAENQNVLAPTEPDGPLDLTLSRNTNCAQQDGVLDLSKKNTSSLDTLVQQRLSGCLWVDRDKDKMKEKGQKWKSNVLEEVMTALCSHHRVLLLHILQEMRSLIPRDERVLTVTLRDKRRTGATPTDERGPVAHPRAERAHCCRTEESVCMLTSCTASSRSCMCRLAVCTLHSMCVKSCALGCVSGVVQASCRVQRQILKRQHSSDVAHAAETSTPPLSVKPADVECKPGYHDLDMHKVNRCSASVQPSSLHPHETHSNKPECTNTPQEESHTHHSTTDHTLKASTCTDYTAVDLDHATMSETATHSIQTPYAHNKPKPFLDSKEPSKQEPTLKMCDDSHLTEIITTVLHSSDDRDCDLKQLFEQHLASEKHSPLTRSQKRQVVQRAISRSHDHPTSRRQSLQIKRDLARLESSTCKRKRKTRTAINSQTSGSLAQSRHTVSDTLSLDTNSEVHSDMLLPQMGEIVKSEAQAQSIGLARSRRNIVPPQRFVSYVTKQKKMINTASLLETNTANVTTTSPNSEMTKPLLNATTSVLSNKREVCEDKDSGRTYPERSLRSRTRRSDNPSAFGHSSDDSIKYISPIKLMLVSSVKGENGVKYTLRAAQANPHEGAFDPCVEASWAGDAIKEETDDEAGHECSEQASERTDVQLSTEAPANTEDSSDSSVNDTALTVKRRPGRPKKFRPLPEKAAKRPIGRPPKPKPTTSSKCGEESKKTKTEDTSSEEDSSKNLKITITYGRRKARRVVCEDSESLPTKQCDNRVPHSPSTSKNTKLPSKDNSVNKDHDPFEFILAMPMEDRNSLHSNIKYPKQSDSTEARRPGRPAKLKISGISITVTTVSPQHRKVHMKREVKESQGRSLVSQSEQSEEEEETGSQNEHASLVPVRYSIRERRPSIYLLNCIASSRSGASKHRSRNLPLNKANEPPQETEPEVTSDSNILTNSTSRESHLQDVVRFSAASVDSIFTSDDKLKWWRTSASPETLKGELDRRIRVMTDTWVSDASRVGESGRSNGAVRNLFERNCNAEMLCSWFMQTTETQSLTIVKKTNTRNSGEVFQYSSVRSSNKASICPSPQAERLRKHLKKFAKIVPKSPAMLRQEQASLHNTCRGSAKRQLFCVPKKSQSETWRTYRVTLDRARSRFKMRTRKTNEKPKENETGCEDLSQSAAGSFTQKDPPAWSTHTLKECSVFLKKLNSANKLLMSEKGTDCSVRLSVSMEQQEQENSTSIKPGKKSNTHSSLPKQCDVNRKRKLSSTSESPPAPRRQRSSRGMMAAKWSDFILGPAR